MNSIMSKFLRSSFLGSVGLAILGGMLIFRSEFAIISISYVIGAILVAIGILALFDFLKNVNQESKNQLDIVYGIVTVIMGIIVIGNPQAIASIIPFVVGLLIVINSAAKLQYSIELKKSENPLWKSTLIISIITLLCGILLVFNPFKGLEIFTIIIGVVILIYAVLDIISTLTIRNTVKKIHTAIEEHIVEADVVEEEDAKEKPEEKEEKINHKSKKQTNKNKKEEENNSETKDEEE